MTSQRTSRAGLGAIEVVVILVIALVVVLLIVAALPRQRETARAVTCQHRLAQIGKAVVIFDDTPGHLPTVAPADQDGPSPLAQSLIELGFADFDQIKDAKAPPPRQPGAVQGERLVPGFICPSDPNALAGRFV